MQNSNPKMLPNTTQLPNFIVDELLPRLGETEFKVLIVIVRQTIGWVEDVETGRRKDRDWISTRQMALRTGMSERSINRAVQALVTQNLVETWTEDGRELRTSQERAQAGSRVYYRLATRNPSLFDKPTPVKSAGGTGKQGNPRQICAPQNLRPTKETLSTKDKTLVAEPQANESKAKEPEEEKVPKTPSPHKQFVDYWHRNVRKARGITPIITGMDGKNLKRILDAGVPTDTLEKAAIYFLHDRSFRGFSPSISTFLSAGVINGLMNKMQNEEGFWKKMDQYLGQQGGLATDPREIAAVADQFAMLRARLAETFKMPYRAPVEH